MRRVGLACQKSLALLLPDWPAPQLPGADHETSWAVAQGNQQDTTSGAGSLPNPSAKRPSALVCARAACASPGLSACRPQVGWGTRARANMRASPHAPHPESPISRACTRLGAGAYQGPHSLVRLRSAGQCPGQEAAPLRRSTLAERLAQVGCSRPARNDTLADTLAKLAIKLLVIVTVE